MAVELHPVFDHFHLLCSQLYHAVTYRSESFVLLVCSPLHNDMVQYNGLQTCSTLFAQGVAWDPASEFVVSQSADRTCRYVALLPASELQTHTAADL